MSVPGAKGELARENLGAEMLYNTTEGKDSAYTSSPPRKRQGIKKDAETCPRAVSILHQVAKRKRK